MALGDSGGALSDAASGAAAGTAVAPGIGTVIGAGVGLLGGILGNEQSAANAAQANATSESELGQAETFAKNQVSDQYIEATSGMKDAGLNPMLAVSSGIGTAGTSVSGVPAVQTPAYRSPIEAAVSSASSLASIDNTRANTAAADSQAALSSAQAAKVREETAGVGYANANLLSSGYLTDSQRKEADTRTALTQAQIDARIPAAQGANIRQETSNLGTRQTLGELDIPRARKEAGFFSGMGGDISPWISHLIAPGASSAASLRNLFR